MQQGLTVKWDNFSINASRSYELLRKDEDFFDVTLVSDDEEQWSAHKLVLSSSSSFFRNILKLNSHTHPWLYLSGVHSSQLEKVLDYIYLGEVTVSEEQVNNFIKVARKLKLEGLKDAPDIEDKEPAKEDHAAVNENEEYQAPTDSDLIEDLAKLKQDKSGVHQYPLDGPDNEPKLSLTDITDLDRNINELMIREKGSSAATCKICGQTSNHSQNLRPHIESHMEDKIAFSCLKCARVYKNRSGFRKHKAPNQCWSEGWTKLKIISKLEKNVNQIIDLNEDSTDTIETSSNEIKADANDVDTSKRQEYPIQAVVEIDKEIMDLIEKHEGSVQCKVCNITSKTILTMRPHVETHLDNISFKCSICERLYKSRESFKKHKWKNSCKSEGWTKMQVIFNAHKIVEKKQFNEETNVNIIIGENTTKLDQSKSVQASNELVDYNKDELSPNDVELTKKISVILQKEGNIFRCGLCGKISNYSQNLIPHIEFVHLTQFSFSCLQCGQSYKSRDRFRKHKGGTGCNSEGWSQMQVVCDELDKAMAVDAENHSKVVVHEKPDEVIQSSTEQDIIVNDEEDREANPGVSKLEKEVRAILVKDGDTTTCTVCKKTSHYYCNMRGHAESHLDYSFACSKCDKYYKTRDGFRKHKVEQGCASEGWSKMKIIPHSETTFKELFSLSNNQL